MISFRSRRFSRHAGLLLLLVGMAGLLFFGRLGCPLLEPEEARYAEIPREMREEGNFLMPVLHGQPYYHKPPLLYWLIMASYSLFGVHDWAARLVPGTAGILTVLLTYFWGRRTVGHRAGFAGALILCLSARFVYFARMLTCDGLLVLWVTGALAAAHVAIQEPRLRRPWWLLGAILCGLGILTKGPVALVLVVGPVLGYQWLDSQGGRIGFFNWVAFLGTAFSIAGPWYLLVAARDPVFLQDFFWTHHVIRFLKPYDHHQPVWFYLPGLLLGMLPWTLLWPGFLRFLSGRNNSGTQPRPAALGFFLIAFFMCLAFFSASGCKRSGYILPAMPPLALALGCYLATAFAQEARYRRRFAYGGFITLAILLVALHQLLPGYIRKFSLRGQVRPQLAMARDRNLHVACYPHGWDSVRFYLGRNDVIVYGPGDEGKVRANLKRWGEMLVFVKSNHRTGKPMTDFLTDLQGQYQFVPLGRGGWVTAGIIQPNASGRVANRTEGSNSRLAFNSR